MSRKRCFVNKKSGKKFEEIFDAFVVAKTAKGVSDVTIRNYHQNLHNISLATLFFICYRRGMDQGLLKRRFEHLLAIFPRNVPPGAECGCLASAER